MSDKQGPPPSRVDQRPGTLFSPEEGRLAWAGLSLILVFVFVLSLVCLLEHRSSPYFTYPVIDEASYVEWAREIARGEVLGGKVFYQDPLYPYFLALIFKLFGVPESGQAHPSWTAARAVQLLLALFSVALVFFTAGKLLGARAALLAALIMALNRTLYFYELTLLKASLVIFFSSLACFLGVWAVDKPRALGRWLGLGLSLGLLTLLRGNVLLILPLLAVWPVVLLRREGWGARFAAVVLITAGIALALLPASVRNYRISGEFVLTTSQGGANFYIGNNPTANGAYAALDFVRPEPRYEAVDFQAEAERRVGRELSPGQVSRFWFREGLTWIAEHPGPAARLWMGKARLLIHDYEVPDNHNFYLTRRHFVRALYIPFIGLALLIGPALVGMAVTLRRDPRFSYPALFGVLYGLSLVPFFILGRYRVAMLPAASIFAAAFVFWLIAKLKNREAGKAALAMAVIAGFFGLGFYPTEQSRWPDPFTHYNLGNVYFDLRKPELALFWYDQALAALPDHPEIQANRATALEMLEYQRALESLDRAGRGAGRFDELVNAGLFFEKRGDWAAAARAYELALSLRPATASLHFRVGRLYLAPPSIRDPARALHHFHRALELDPENLQVISDIGSCHFLLGDRATARKWWEKALAQDPEFGPAREGMKLLSGPDR